MRKKNICELVSEGAQQKRSQKLGRWGLSLTLLIFLAAQAKAQVQNIISTPTYPANGSYFNLQNQTPNFNWFGPSTTTIQLATSPVYNLQVGTDPTFAAGLVINVQIAAVIPSTGLPNAYGSYLSGTSLTNNTTYYWRVYATDSSGGESMSWSTFSFVTDFAPDSNLSASYSGTLNSLGQTTPENQFVSLSNGATSQLSVSASFSGIAVSSSAVPLTGDSASFTQGTSGYGVLYSTNSGTTWEDYSSLGINVPAAGGGATIWNLAVFNGFLYAGLSNGSIIHTNNGTSWNTDYTGSNYGIGGFTIYKNTLYASNHDGSNAYMVSITNAGTVNRATVFNSGAGVSKPVVLNNTLFVEASYTGIPAGDPGAGNAGGGIFASQDGIHWVQTSGVGVCSDNFDQLFTFNGELYANVQSGGFGCSGLFVSPDGVNWTTIDNQSVPGTVNTATVFNGKLYIGVNNGGSNPLLYSSTNGQSWSADNGTLTQPSLGGSVNDLNVVNGKLYAGISTTTARIYVTEDGNNWFPSISGGTGQTGAGAPVYFNGNFYAAAGPDIITISPFSASLPGSNGEPSGTLSAVSPQLAASTTTTTCGGVSPCNATNQVIFTASDMAGNTLMSGPYAILVDTEVGVAISTPSYPGTPTVGQSPPGTVPYVNVQPNFDWIGPSTGVASALQQPANFFLEVSSNDPTFSPSNIVISTSTPVVVYSTNVPTANGAYLSPYVLGNNTTYYWRIYIKDNLGGTSPTSPTYKFITDFAQPAVSTSSFQSINAQSSLLPENQFNDLASGVTAQITVQDTNSGLAVSTSALSFAGDGHDDPPITSGFGIIYSTNAGFSWIVQSTSAEANNGSAVGTGIRSLAVFNGDIYAGDYSGHVYYSADGNTWSAGTPGTNPIQSLSVFNGILYAGDGGGYIYSSSNGSTWSTTNGGSAVGAGILAMTVFNGQLYAGDNFARVFVMDASGNWHNVDGGTVGTSSIESLAAFNGQLYAGDYYGNIYASTNGSSWNSLGTIGNSGSLIETMAVFNGKLYAGDSNGFIHFSANGASWTTSNNGSAVGSGITALTVFNGQLYAVDALGYVHISADGVHWNSIKVATQGTGLAGFNGNLYVGDYYGAVYRAIPLAATLSGSDGTTASQTLSANNLNLVQSTTTATCGGTSPCSATDQIIFTASDLAGNVVESGPYAILVDTTVAPAISTPSYPLNGAYLNFNPNFNWTGPSTSIVSGLLAPSYYQLEVSSNDPTFATVFVNISTPIPPVNTGLSTDNGAYISTYTFANLTTYYWRVRTIDGFGGTSPWSTTFSFTTDFSSPTAVGGSFATLNSLGGLVPENQVTVLQSGVTAQINITDIGSGFSAFNSSNYSVRYSTNAGLSWISEPFSALAFTGSIGQTSTQTFTAYGLNLAASTNSYVCGGISPCGATNQVEFTFSDQALNFSTAGPFAVIVDTHSTDVLVSTANVAPLGIPQNTSVAFIRLTLNSLTGTAPWTGLTVQRLGSGTDADVQNVAIYRDNAGTGIFSPSDTQITQNAVFSGGIVNLTMTNPESITTSTKTYFLVYTAAPGALVGDGLAAEITSTASFTFSNGYQMSSAQTTIYPLISSTATVVDGPNYLYITPASQAPNDAPPGTANIEMLSLKAYTNTGTSTLSKIVFHLLGTGASNDISSISIYRDSNGTGVYAPNDSLVTSGSDSFFNGVSTVAFTTTIASETVTTSPIYYFVLISLSPNAPLGDTLGISISTTSDVELIDVLDTTTFTTSPAASSLLTIEYINTLNVQGVNQIPSSLLQGQQYAILKASFTVSTGETSFNGITITRIGLGHDSDVSAVRVWQDPAPPETFNPATFLQLSSGTFVNGNAQLNFPLQTLSAGTTYVYYVTYNISPTALQGDTLGGRITSNLDISDTNPGTTIVGNFSINSATSPVVPTTAGLFVSAQNVAPSDLLQGATNQQMLNLTMDTTQYSVLLGALTFNSLGTASSSDISRVEVYQDLVGNGILNTSTDPLLSAVSYPFISGTGIIPFSPGITISTIPIRLLVAVDVSTGANYLNNDFGIGISTPANISINAPNFVVPSTTTFPADSSIIPITKAPDVMSVFPTSLMDVNGVVQGQNAPAAKLSLVTQHSSVTWTTISVQRSGTLPDSGVDSVNIYDDVDQNGVLDSSDVLVGSAPFVSGTANISFSTAQLVSPAGADYLITLQIDPNATPGDTIGISLSGVSNFTVLPPDTVSGSSLPFNSALGPVLNIKTPTQPIVTFPNGDYSSSFDSVGFIWYSTVAVGSISSAAYAVGTTPGGTDIAPYTAIPFAASSFTATNLLLSNGATYYVSVEATSNYGFTSPPGISPGFLVDLITPGSPTNLSANVGVSSIYLTWDPGTVGPSGASGYLLEYSDVEHPTWYNAKTGAVTALAAGPHGTLSANFIPSSPFLFNNPPQGTLLFRVSLVNGAGVQSAPSNSIRVLFGTQSNAGISNVSSYPNPFNSNSGVATIVYTLDTPGNVSIQIYSVFGSLVKSLSYSGGSVGGQAGVNTVTWDGTDSGGRKVSKGIYIAVLKANGMSVQYKIGVNH